MAPHMTKIELDKAFAWQGNGHTAAEIHAKLTKLRARRDQEGPDLTTVRRTLRGKTHKRGLKETRGAKPKLTALQLRKLNTARKALIKKAKKEGEVHYEHIMEKAGVNHVTASTVSKHFKEKLGVAWRAPREEPLREKEDEEERVEICKKWKYYPDNYFTERIDAIHDIKQFDCPLYEKGKRYLKMKKVRGQLRTKAEGIKKEFTKPKSNKTRVNTGATVKVCAVIIDCKVKVWHYLPKRWCGDAAVDLYNGPIIKALRKHRGVKKNYHIVEDNDPSGYKANKAIAAKKALGIKPIVWPRYSPDLMPQDFYLWDEVNRRLAAQSPPAKETLDAFKRRLQRTALSIPKESIQRAVLQMQSKAAEVVEAEGGRIPSD